MINLLIETLEVLLMAITLFIIIHGTLHLILYFTNE